MIRSEIGSIFWGAGFLLLFLYELVLCLVQYLIIKKNKISIIIGMPSAAVPFGSETRVHYSVSAPFLFLPGIGIDIETIFSWKDRVIRGRAAFAGEGAESAIILDACLRGRFVTDGANFIISGPAGFFRVEILAGSREEFRVLPERVDVCLRNNLIIPGGEHSGRKNRKERNDDLLEIRQYFPGDDIRRINWKTFAHCGELFIRTGEEQPLPESKLRIVLDLSGPSGRLSTVNAGHYLDVFVSKIYMLTEVLESAGVSVELSVISPVYESFENTEQFCRLWWTPVVPAVKVFGNTSSGRQGRPGGYLLVTSPFSSVSVDLCRQLGRSGTAVSVIIPVPENTEVAADGRIAERIFLSGSGSETAVIEQSVIDMIRTESLNKCRELKEYGRSSDVFIL